LSHLIDIILKIIEIDIPKNQSNGLFEIKMIKLENIVCIAGQNGSGVVKSINLKNFLLVISKLINYSLLK
jgi:hypothetical protein